LNHTSAFLECKLKPLELHLATSKPELPLTGELYARKFEIKWLAYTYAEKLLTGMWFDDHAAINTLSDLCQFGQSGLPVSH